MSFEEDPVENARICIDVASHGCVDCRDFHLRSVLRRLNVPPSDKIGDLLAFKNTVGGALQEIRKSTAPIRVGIVGSTDTGILATLLSTADGVGGTELVSKLRLTLIDQCDTPLQICLAFAERVGVPLVVQHSDFLQAKNTAAFDLVLMHGVVPFFPAAQQHDYLSHIATWLAPDGVLVSSTHLGTKPNSDTDEKRAKLAIENLRGPAAQLLNLDMETVDRLASQLAITSQGGSVQSVFANIAEATAAYEGADLLVTSKKVVRVDGGQASKQIRKYKTRFIVTCRRTLHDM